jgi:large subunit ribosomal protein L7/L12
MAKLSTDEIIDGFKEMTLLEVADFVKKFETTFDVTAAAPVATQVDIAVEPEVVEEQTEFDVILEAAGAKKIGVIKVVREIDRSLSLKEAKDLVDAAPKQILGMVSKGIAGDAAQRLKAAGATVTVR